MTVGLLITALLPVAAAVSAAEPTSTTPAPVAITQPLGAIGASPLFGGTMLSEAGLLMLVGTALMGLAGVVRRTTRT